MPLNSPADILFGAFSAQQRSEQCHRETLALTWRQHDTSGPRRNVNKKRTFKIKSVDPRRTRANPIFHLPLYLCPLSLWPSRLAVAFLPPSLVTPQTPPFLSEVIWPHSVQEHHRGRWDNPVVHPFNLTHTHTKAHFVSLSSTSLLPLSAWASLLIFKITNRGDLQVQTTLHTCALSPSYGEISVCEYCIKLKCKSFLPSLLSLRSSSPLQRDCSSWSHRWFGKVPVSEKYCDTCWKTVVAQPVFGVQLPGVRDEHTHSRSTLFSCN